MKLPIIRPFAGWDFPRYKWEDKLEMTDDYTIKKTGLSRKQLEKVLDILSENGVID